jgi:hypothetical protein
VAASLLVPRLRTLWAHCSFDVGVLFIRREVPISDVASHPAVNQVARQMAEQSPHGRGSRVLHTL